jgi:hypothetical protein
VTEGDIRLWPVEPPEGGSRRLAVSPEYDLETPARERDRLDLEAGRAALLVAEASPEQSRMLEQLATRSAGGILRFRSVAIAERFLAATATATASAGGGLTDDEVLAAWEEAGGGSDR